MKCCYLPLNIPFCQSPVEFKTRPHGDVPPPGAHRCVAVAAAAAAPVNFTQPATALNASTIPTVFTVPCLGGDCITKKKHAFFANLVVVRRGGDGGSE